MCWTQESGVLAPAVGLFVPVSAGCRYLKLEVMRFSGHPRANTSLPLTALLFASKVLVKAQSGDIDHEG